MLTPCCSAACDLMLFRWYFDAVSTSTNASVVIVFFNSGSNGFTNQYLGGPLSVQISGSFSNGSLFSFSTPATDGAVVRVSDRGLEAEWKGSGFSILGTSLNHPFATYVVSVEAPDISVEGKFTLVSVSCSPDIPVPLAKAYSHNMNCQARPGSLSLRLECARRE